MIRLHRVFARLASDLKELDLRWAVIGGLAVSVRAEPRATRDVDVAILVGDDEQAESVASSFIARGYRIQTVLEHKMTGRMATIRFLAPGESPQGVLVDLFFASSGLESEIVLQAEELELWSGTRAPVAATAHLLALKVLASRPRDLDDVRWLLKYATADEVESAQRALDLIKARGYDREKDLKTLWRRATKRGGEEDANVFVDRGEPDDLELG